MSQQTKANLSAILEANAPKVTFWLAKQKKELTLANVESYYKNNEKSYNNNAVSKMYKHLVKTSS